MKFIWPLFEFVARYFSLLMNFAILAFGIYFQIALIWAIFLVIYLVQTWWVSRAHRLYMKKQITSLKNKFVPGERYMITDEECIAEYESFNKNVHNVALDSRHSFWVTQFVLLIVAMVMVYLSVFINTAFTD